MKPNFSFASRRRLYEALPDVLRKPFQYIPFGVAAGRQYRQALRQRGRIDRAAPEELRALQEKALARMLAFACDQIPIYRDLRSTVDRLPPFEALKAFPLVDKDRIQRDFAQHLPRDIDRIPHYECTTGGTSGNQLRFYLDASAHARELGFIHGMWARVGYSPRATKATFRGVPFGSLEEGVYWQPNPVYRELQFSPFHMSPRTLPRYVEKLREFQPEFMHGYPSAIGMLADFVARSPKGSEGVRPKAVLLASEGPEPGQQDLIEAAFGCRSFSWYGHSEQLVLAGECEKSRIYHHFPDYGILEIVNPAGDPVAEGERGEIVGTGLFSRSLPLIRYRTEDYARRLPRDCECGRRFERFDEVEGRWGQDFLIGRNGARISLAALNMHGSVFEEVLRYQYRQNKPGNMELRLMVTDAFGDEDARNLERAFEDKVGSELSVELCIVDEVPLTARGKLRRLIQEIPAENGA